MTPEQVNTIIYVAVVLIVPLLFTLGALLWKEWKTLSDDIPDNHITASFRAAFKRQPGVVMLLIILFVVNVVVIFWGVLVHLFWP